MPLVERQQPAGLVPCRNDHRAQISEAGVEVLVTPLQVDDHTVVVRLEALDAEPASSEIGQKRQPRATSKALSQQVIHLSCDWCGDEKLTGLLLQHALDTRSQWVRPVGLDGAVQADAAGQWPLANFRDRTAEGVIRSTIGV